MTQITELCYLTEHDFSSGSGRERGMTMNFGDQKAQELQAAYQAAGQVAIVREVSPGRYEVVKPRIRQIITHRELCQEIERLSDVHPGGE